MKIKLFILFLVLSSGALAQGSNSGLKFLTTTESRTASLGETSIINSYGVSSALGNPSGLCLTESSEVQIGVMKSIQDINSQYLLLKLKSSDKLSFGFHLLNYKISDIEIREIPGESQGTFSSQYLSTGLSAAYKATGQFTLGATAKFLYEKIFVEDASGFAFDIGGNYKVNDKFILAASVTNLGTMSKLNEVSTELPISAGVGVAYGFDISVLTNTAFLEVKNNFQDKKIHFSMALESNYNNLLFARFGYITGYDSRNVTAGLGIKYWDFDLSYSFIPYSYNLGDHHSVSLKFII